jgi:tRNA threonylcarbamoyladenosine modification (KEOPS) complex Cgi121 subunit
MNFLQLILEPHHLNLVKMNESLGKFNGTHQVESKFKVIKYGKNALNAVKVHAMNIGKIAKQKLRLGDEQPEFPYFE